MSEATKKTGVDTPKIGIGKQIKDFLITSLGGMGMGLFSTLIIGLIIQQISKIFGTSQAAVVLNDLGKMATILTGSAIGIGIANSLKSSPLIIYSSAVTGLIGAHAASIVTRTIFNEAGAPLIAGPGDPLGAMVAAMVGVLVARLIAGKTKVDILLVPLATIISGGVAAYFVGPPISQFMVVLGDLIGKATEFQPFLMGIILSLAMGFALTFPLSSAALSMILGLTGLPAGAATVGCCCQMVGYAAASFRENGVSGIIAQGVGTSKVQLPNIFKNPWTYLPVVVPSIILAPVSTMLFKMTNNAAGAGMGTSGFVGQIMTFQTMTEEGGAPLEVVIKIVVLHFVLPAIIALITSEIMRKKGLIKFGDMKLDA